MAFISSIQSLGGFDPTEWWRNQVQQQELTKIREAQRVQRERLDFDRERFEESIRQRNEILAMFQGAFDEKGGGFNVPSEFGENVALFQPGGQFGAGAKMEIERGGQQAISAGQLGFAQTGMSSGTNVAGLRSRVLADTALSKAKVEGERVSRLGGALTQAGTAGLTTQQLRAQREAEMLRTLSTFG